MFTTVNLSQDTSKISNYISSTLLQSIDETIKKWEKVLLYLNKRWSYSSLICEDCQYLFECPHCDVSLSVHSNPDCLRCHICNNAFSPQSKCRECWSKNIKSIGVGTQQIESVLRENYPKEKIYRFDSDNMKNISSKKQALSQLESANIIIGTKMITTGFDFEKIGLISLILVEWELGYPSYDALEKAYSNLRQVIGRGNRKSQKTHIILQTFIPNNPVLKLISESNYKDFFHLTLKERKEFLYPPFTQMVTLEYRHKNSVKSLEYIKNLEQTLQTADSDSSYTFLRWSSTFRKNNTHHSTLIIRGENIRSLLTHIEKKILSESSLSVVFH